MKDIKLTDLQITTILEALYKAEKENEREGAWRSAELCEDAIKAIKEQAK